MLVPGILNGSGINGTGASDASKNERTYLKSANTVRYLSHRSARERTVEGLAISRWQAPALQPRSYRRSNRRRPYNQCRTVESTGLHSGR